MLLLSVYETFLYYCCLLLVCRYILNCSPKKFYLYGSFTAFIPLVLIAISGNNTLHNIAYIIFVIGQFLLIRLIFKKIKLRYILLTYILLYATNTLMISLLFNITALHNLFIDFFVNTVSCILFLLLCTTKPRDNVRQLMALIPTRILISLSALLISTTIVSVVIFRSLENTNIWNNIPKIALAILQIATCFTIIFLLTNSISNNHLKSLTQNYEHQIEVQAKYYKELAAANYDSRRFRHDYKNMQIAIEKLLADGKNQEALQLIQECGNAIDNPDGLQGAFDTGNGIADALLTDKQQTAKLYNAVIHFQGAIAQDALLPTDLCVILGNTLDNAIEACQKLPPETEKTISITCSCNSGFLFLTVCNPVAEKVIVQNNRVATTKEDKTLHGFGLYSLQSVVKKYNGELHLHSTEDSFTVNIDLCVMSPQAQPSAK